MKPQIFMYLALQTLERQKCFGVGLRLEVPQFVGMFSGMSLGSYKIVVIII